MSPAGALVARYAAVVCDLDGVVYRGPTAVPHAVEVLGALDVPVLYATNNASRSPADVATHLRELGLPCTAGGRGHQLAGRCLAARRPAGGRQPGAGRGRCRRRGRPDGGGAAARAARRRREHARSTPCCRATAPR